MDDNTFDLLFIVFIFIFIISITILDNPAFYLYKRESLLDKIMKWLRKNK